MIKPQISKQKVKREEKSEVLTADFTESAD